jgi:pseudouridine-5'-phosphate glycosidase
MSSTNLIIHEEVAEALFQKSGVVALESTVIAHGLPYPLNIQCALELQDIIREEGAVPATIAVIDGTMKVGLLDEELWRLADLRANVLKLSRRDLAYAISSRALGATTVSATMIIANWAGINIFATGGIGGVHRNAEKSFDISADILELSRTPVAVVSSGAKSILDLAKTLEMLESHGVPVYGHKTSFFPEFYCQGLRLTIPMRFDSSEDLAHALFIHRKLGLKNGILIGQNAPSEHALDATWLENIIGEAEALAEKAQVHGKELTPFLLKEIANKTSFKSTSCNIALLKANAKLAASIAKACALLSLENSSAPQKADSTTSLIA